MRTKGSLGIVVGAIGFLVPMVVNAAGYHDVEAMAKSAGSWTVFAFPTQIARNAAIKVNTVTCESPRIEDVQIVLVPKGTCVGEKGSPRPKGATRPEKIEGLRNKLADSDLCASTAAAMMKCMIYADTEW